LISIRSAGDSLGHVEHSALGVPALAQVLDGSERDDRHGALLDADMTADALILMEHQLKPR
jgi:hypothetical protein